VIAKLPSIDKLSQLSTESLKNKLLEVTQDRDTESLNKKVLFYQNELSPLFEELSRRNPFPSAQEQALIVIGVWSPIWSTIPFQDILPGRIREQSYQIFHENGYYANIGRYAPGHRLSFLQNISPKLSAYDLMVIQKYEVQNGQWYIQNVGIEQAFRRREIPLDIDEAEDWFTTTVKSKFEVFSQTINFSKAPDLKDLDQNTLKRFNKVFLATPHFEHLYIDSEFRVVKTQREAKQRPSYTIAVRRR
jgi:hypothetical protein